MEPHIRFMFIDVNNDRRSSSEAIRVHVMRESHRARRNLRGLRQVSANSRHGEMTILTPGAPQDLPSNIFEESYTAEGESYTAEEENYTAEEETYTAEEETYTAEEENYATEEENYAIDEFISEQLNNTSHLATSRVAVLQEALQYKLAGIEISQLETLLCLPPGTVHPESFRADLPQLCGDDPGPLNALLAITEFVSAVDSSSHNCQITITELESQALEALQERIASTRDAPHSDQTLLTVLLLARLEQARENSLVAQYHEAALTTMVAQRGGREIVAESSAMLGVLLP